MQTGPELSDYIKLDNDNVLQDHAMSAGASVDAAYTMSAVKGSSTLYLVVFRNGGDVMRCESLHDQRGLQRFQLLSQLHDAGVSFCRLLFLLRSKHTIEAQCWHNLDTNNYKYALAQSSPLLGR